MNNKGALTVPLFLTGVSVQYNYYSVEGSSKGRKADFDSANLGSNPSPSARFMEAWVSGCKPTVLKTVLPQGNVGSNPTVSANLLYV